MYNRLFLILLLLVSFSSVLYAENFRASAPSLLTHKKCEFSSVIRCIVNYKGNMWFGTYGDGLYFVDRKKHLKNFTSSNSPLLENRVNCLEVFEHKLWIGTCKGINVYDGKPIATRF